MSCFKYFDKLQHTDHRHCSYVMTVLEAQINVIVTVKLIGLTCVLHSLLVFSYVDFSYLNHSNKEYEK